MHAFTKPNETKMQRGFKKLQNTIYDQYNIVLYKGRSDTYKIMQFL